jgi:hypothetical protein
MLSPHTSLPLARVADGQSPGSFIDLSHVFARRCAEVPVCRPLMNPASAETLRRQHLASYQRNLDSTHHFCLERPTEGVYQEVPAGEHGESRRDSTACGDSVHRHGGRFAERPFNEGSDIPMGLSDGYGRAWTIRTRDGVAAANPYSDKSCVERPYNGQESQPEGYFLLCLHDIVDYDLRVLCISRHHRYTKGGSSCPLRNISSSSAAIISGPATGRPVRTE